MTAREHNASNGAMIVVEGRVLSPSAYRPSSILRVENTVAWWASLALVGGTLVAAGLLVYSGAGETLAVAGVALFLLAGVLAGAEWLEAATAVGVGAIVWTATGISLVLDTDPSRAYSLLGFVVVGGMAVICGAIGASRVHRPPAPPPAS
jgi:hypothetical protein